MFSTKKPVRKCAIENWIMSRWILISLGIFTIALPSVIQAGIVSFSYGSSGSLISQQATAAGIPVISSQPISIPVAAPGFVAGFSVNIVSASPVSYQWYFNGVLIPGATGDSLLFTNPTPVQEGSYTVTVTNSSGSVTSAAAILAIDSNGNELPDSWEMTYFGNLDQKGFDDFSGDGITNLNKYLNGLDPTQKTPWTWIASNGDFNTPENWDYQRDRSPKVGDVCIVNTGTFSTSSQITASQVTVGVSFTTPSSADFLLNVTGSWTFNGAFTLSSGRMFTVTGGGSVSVAGNTTLNNASIYVYGTSTKLSFPNLTSYTQPLNKSSTWIAGYLFDENTGCELNFPALQTITGSVVTAQFLDATLTAEAKYGAVINFPTLTSISVPVGTSADNSTDGVRLYAHDAGAIQAAFLTSFTDDSSSPASSLNFNSLSNLSSLNTISGVALTLNAGAMVNPLADITGLTSIYVHGTGTKLSFPNVTSYTQPANTPVTWAAGSPSYGYEDNTGCELNFPALQSITGSVVTTQYLDATLTAEAQNGATLSFPALTSIAVPVGTSADYGTNGVSLFATDSGRLYAAKLTDFEDLSTPSFSRIEASANSTYRFASLRQAGLQGVTLNGVTLLTGPVNLQPPVITSPGSIVSLRGQALSYTITANNHPFTLTATPLPGGLSVNTSTGHLSGTPAAIGIYLITLSAENPDGISTLPLTLTVIPASFDDFLDQAGVPINKRGQLDDPDNDGIPNLLEFALGQPPMTSTTRAAQRLMLSQTTISFIYPHSRPDVSYSVETTDNLSDPFSWTTSGVTQGTVDTYGYVTATISATGQRRFVRLKVTLIP